MSSDRPMKPLVGSGRHAADLTAQDPDPSRVAVLLNRNARRVTERLLRRVQRLAGRENVFVSRNLDEAEACCREMVQRGYGTIVAGGGDGTLMRAANMVRNYIAEANAWRTEHYLRLGDRQSLLGMPRFAFLRLGTGNGLTRLVGAASPLRDLQHIVDFAPGRTFSLPAIECAGERFFFAGLGYDSIILDDYNYLKGHTHSPLLKPLVHNVLGYLAAFCLRTLPRLARGRHPRVEARISTNEDAYYIDPRRGDAVEVLEAGSTLFEGSAGLVAAATTPFYGYSFKVFPFARLYPDRMMLRVASLGAATALRHLRGLWRGTYRNPEGILDFAVRSISIELSHPYPFQHSGDAQGLRERLELKVAPEPIRLVDLHTRRWSSG